MSEDDRYLDAMGVTQWVPRSVTEEPVEVEQVIEELVVEELVVEEHATEEHVTDKVNGLNWLSDGCSNGLLVVLPAQRRQLSPENRSLMSKMLNSIQFSPKETGFATVSSTSNNDNQVSLNQIKAILVFGQEAGAALVQICGAKNVSGTDYYLLNDIKIVCTLHPEDLVEEPDLKQQAWKDLKQLLALFNH